MQAALLLAAISLFTSFEGGSLGKVEMVGPGQFRCSVQGEADQDGRNRQANWYYFRVDGAKGREITIELADLVGEYNYRAGTHAVTRNTRPVYSYDNENWTHFGDEQVEWDDSQIRLRLRLTPAEERVWVAHVAPYTNQHLDALLRDTGSHAHMKRETIGRTVEGRPMVVLTITNPRVAEARKKVAWLMFRQHSWEAGSSWTGEGAIRRLLSEAGARLRDEVIWKIFPLADPDGVARGGVRFNNHGYDLNRNWDLVKAELMPEIAAQKEAILNWLDSGRRIDFFLTLHNTESGEYLEGPDVGIGGRVFAALGKTSFHPSSALRVAPASTTPGKPGRMTVSQGLWAERQVPAFVMEQRVEFNSKLGRLPSVEDRLRFGAELVEAIGVALR